VVQGRSVTPLEVWAVTEQFKETRSALFQIVRPQREVDELRVRVGYASDRTPDHDELRERLIAGLAQAIGVTPSVQLIDEQAIIAGTSSAAKIPRIVNS
jgi:phenylacetate-CoA ligase